MTRAGQEPAQDVKRKLVAACRELGLEIKSASARLAKDHGVRLVHVEASPPDWSHEISLISLLATVSTNGAWSECVDIRSAPADEDATSLNPPFRISVPHMKGRRKVSIKDAVAEIRNTMDEREQVIAAAKCGIPGPYSFGDVVWEVPF